MRKFEAVFCSVSFFWVLLYSVLVIYSIWTTPTPPETDPGLLRALPPYPIETVSFAECVGSKYCLPCKEQKIVIQDLVERGYPVDYIDMLSLPPEERPRRVPTHYFYNASGSLIKTHVGFLPSIYFQTLFDVP